MRNGTLKIQETLTLIGNSLKDHKNPVVLSSFGKDSMVLLHLLRKVSGKIPVVFWRENSQFQKYGFANRMINMWNLSVYDYLPIKNEILYHNGRIDGVGFRTVGNAFFSVHIELARPYNGLFSCALKEIIGKPKTFFEYPWDTTFIGAKSSDVDPILGPMKLKTDSVPLGNTLLVFPLKDWTDEDIWDYTRTNHLPYDERRYNKDNGFKEFEDKTYNNNYHFACTDCINPEEEEEVYCPMVMKKIVNMGKNIDYAGKLKTYKATFTYIESE